MSPRKIGKRVGAGLVIEGGQRFERRDERRYERPRAVNITALICVALSAAQSSSNKACVNSLLRAFILSGRFMIKRRTLPMSSTNSVSLMRALLSVLGPVPSE